MHYSESRSNVRDLHSETRDQAPIVLEYGQGNPVLIIYKVID
jgi:hypothetical protein